MNPAHKRAGGGATVASTERVTRRCRPAGSRKSAWRPFVRNLVVFAFAFLHALPGTVAAAEDLGDPKLSATAPSSTTADSTVTSNSNRAEHANPRAKLSYR